MIKKIIETIENKNVRLSDYYLGGYEKSNVNYFDYDYYIFPYGDNSKGVIKVENNSVTALDFESYTFYGVIKSHDLIIVMSDNSDSYEDVFSKLEELLKSCVTYSEEEDKIKYLCNYYTYLNKKIAIEDKDDSFDYNIEDIVTNMNECIKKLKHLGINIA